MSHPVEPVPAILLVRLKPRQAYGELLGESRLVCHLVPAPASEGTPDRLVAYCGLAIAPGCADLLTGISGAPCEKCLAKSPIPAFALLRSLPLEIGET